ncbi:hypothetical protein VP01_530g5 [Puccinia sorghi]|uniref:Uncharacterized protein n=1 Tax=Puccinia sorghi TaxID=27349 RepID=A0A0L6UK96_9BASI|nr:hypothetical protein VP01_530g5 [Puccinia sorghi]
MVFVKYLANMKTLCFCWLLLGKSIDSINSALKTAIHPHSCARWKALYEKPQEVMWNPPNYDPCVHPPSLTNEEVYFVLEVLKVDPTLYLDELQKKLEEATRQKSGTVKMVHPSQCPLKHTQFSIEVSAFPSNSSNIVESDPNITTPGNSFTQPSRSFTFTPRCHLFPAPKNPSCWVSCRYECQTPCLGALPPSIHAIFQSD